MDFRELQCTIAILLLIGSSTPTPCLAQTKERPPEIAVVKTMAENGGWGRELHRITISGIATNKAGTPIANAEIFASAFPRIQLGKTLSDSKGRFLFEDVQLPVDRRRPGQVTKPTQGKFCVFGVADGFGATWFQRNTYRPYARPNDVDPVDPDQKATQAAYYRDEEIYVRLVFRPAASLRGQIVDDFGAPIPGAKIQVGLVDNLNRPGSFGSWSCKHVNADGEATDQQPFDGIYSLPTEYREARADEQGNYAFHHLPRDAQLTALVQPGDGYEPYRFTLQTTPVKPQPNNRAEVVGYDGTLNRLFNSPREVWVQTLNATTQTPVSNIGITASSKKRLKTGTQAVSKDGRAMLLLPPGEYELLANPESTSRLLPATERLIIAEGSEKLQQSTILLQPTAILSVQVVDESNGPVEGVAFEYSTESNSELLPLHSQEVYSDFPTTNAEGILDAYVTPEKRRIRLAESSDYEAVGTAVSQLLDLRGGATVSTGFVVRRTGEQFAAPAVDDDPHGIYAKWHEQSVAWPKTQAIISMQMIRGRLPGVDPEDLRTAVQKLTSNEKPDLMALLNSISDEEVKSASMKFAVSGRKRRESFTYPSGSTDTPSVHVSLDNGVHAMFYGSGNNQADVHDLKGSRRGFTRLDDFLPNLFLRRKAANLIKPIIAGDRLLFHADAGPISYVITADKDTGFIYESSRGGSGRFPERVDLYFAPKTLQTGAILPQAHVGWGAQNGKITRFNMHLVDNVEVLDALPPNTFALSVPAGCNIWDHRGDEPNQPRNRRFKKATHPVQDAIKFLDERGVNEPRRPSENQN